MKIRFKILAGFILLVIMLIIAGLMSIYEFSRISKSVNSLIEDNYKTIEASKTMLEALEREDSGILLLIAGHWQEGSTIINKADSTFYSAMQITKLNLSEKDEDKYIEEIEIAYLKYKSKWELPTLKRNLKSEIDIYFKDLHTDFINVKIKVKSLMTLNQDSMHEEANILSQQAERAIMPGIVAIITALIFLVLFNFFISRLFVRPVEKLINSLKSYNSATNEFNSNISTQDELKDLENEIQKAIGKLKKGMVQ